MTINKSQGQTFDKVGIYVSKQIFGHGQLYVSLSRCINKDQIKVFTYDNDNLIHNIVYKEIFYSAT